MEILKKIFTELIKFIYISFLKKDIQSRKLEKEEEENITSPPSHAIYNKTAWKFAEEFLLIHRDAYLGGYNKWGKCGEPGSHNSVLYCYDSSEFKKILRFYRSTTGLYEFKKYLVLSKKSYDESLVGIKYETYCNIFASIFTDRYCGFRICRYDGTQYSANGCYNSLKNGVYNTNENIFKSVTLKEALEYAKNGGLALVSWYNKKRGKSGHIAVLTGEGSSLNPGHCEIFQAGKYFGYMSIRKGFGIGKWAVSKYYIWQKKDE